MKISVIIPVFNSEKYLEECIDSVLSQTYKNIEIIIVNDGSTDKSGEICDRYAGNDSRIKVIHVRNGGAGKARNIALELIGNEYVARNIAINNANGDYYMFLDSDDYWLNKNIVKDIVSLLNESKADVLSFQYEEFFDECKRPVFSDGDLMREEVLNKAPHIAIKSLLSKSRAVFSSVPHTKVVKASFMQENTIKFPEGLNCEDVFFTAELLRTAKSYDRYNKVSYAFRRTTQESTTTQPDKKLKIAKNMLTVFDMVFETLEKNKTKERDLLIYDRILDFMSSPYAYMLGIAAGALEFYDNKNEINAVIENMQKYRFTLKYSSRPYLKSIYLFCLIFGIKLTVEFLRVFLKINKNNVLGIKK